MWAGCLVSWTLKPPTPKIRKITPGGHLTPGGNGTLMNDDDDDDDDDNDADDDDDDDDFQHCFKHSKMSYRSGSSGSRIHHRPPRCIGPPHTN